MKARDVQENKLYVGARGEFRYIVPHGLHGGCNHTLLGREIQYLYVSEYEEEEFSNFPCTFQTFQRWAKREATSEEYAQYRPVIDKTLKKLELQLEINRKEREQESNAINQIMLRCLSTEALEAELKRRKAG